MCPENRAPEQDLKELTMVTTNTKTQTTEMPEIAEKIREQFISTVKQGQKISVAAAQTWVKAVSVLPIPEMPAIAGLPNVPGMEAATKYTFDLAADLLTAQRDFALQLEKVLVSEKSAA
jgi:hypothetical protein